MANNKKNRVKVNAEGRVEEIKPTLIADAKRNKWLILLCLPVIVLLIIFAYIPMGGLYMAFVNYRSTTGIFGSEFVGFENFRAFFSTDAWIRITANKLYLNALFILFTTFFSIVIAIMLSEVKNKMFKKITQSVVILPHFMSWTIVALFSVAIIASDGAINQIIRTVTGNPEAGIDFYNNPMAWPPLLVCLRIWQGAGYGSIVYLATITGIDQEIYEAAKIDGANRWQQIFRITLPLLKNTIIMLTIMSVGKIFYGDFGMIYALVGNQSQLYSTTDVIDTYVYRLLMTADNLGTTAAIGLIQSCLGFLFVIGCNKLAKVFSPESALF